MGARSRARLSFQPVGDTQGPVARKLKKLKDASAFWPLLDTLILRIH